MILAMSVSLTIFPELCVRLQREGIPVKRAALHLLIQHPQWRGARIFWADGMREATITRVDYDVRERSEYIGSPVQEIHGGATEVRENLAPILRWAASMASMTSGGRRA